MKIHLQFKPNHPAAKAAKKHWAHTDFNYSMVFDVFEKTFAFPAGTSEFLLEADLLTITEYPVARTEGGEDSKLAGLWVEIQVELDNAGCDNLLIVIRDVMKSKMSKQDKINAIVGCSKLI